MFQRSTPRGFSRRNGDVITAFAVVENDVPSACASALITADLMDTLATMAKAKGKTPNWASFSLNPGAGRYIAQVALKDHTVISESFTREEQQ